MVVRIYGNRPIKTLTGQNTRPTTSRVREALFNIWQGNVHGCRWLDLCAGSGALGAEALCRGATRVVGIEKVPKACAIIQHNWESVCSSQQSIQVMRGDVLQRIDTLSGQVFDRIYFDPPYASELYHPVLEAIATVGLLSDGGEIAVEHDRAQVLPDEVTPKATGHNQPCSASDSPPSVDSTLTCCRRKHYGRTSLTFYRHQKHS
ncbi:MAG: 16S rRNA (guanine(966)-N(2))-methyltransferase RsmD [Cyanobacteria bacterium P01_A01_bin.37]